MRSSACAARSRRAGGRWCFTSTWAVPIRAAPVLYPSTDAHLPPGTPCDLFRWSSALPEYMIAALRAANLPVSIGGRGMIFNASVADLIRMLSLVKAYAENGGCDSRWSTGFSRNEEPILAKGGTSTIPAEAGTPTLPPDVPLPDCPA